MACLMRIMPGMKTTFKKTAVVAGALLAGLLLMGQEPASETVSQDFVSVSNPVKQPHVEAASKASALSGPAASARKVEWRSDEAKRRLAGQGGVAAAEPSRLADSKAPAQKDEPSSWRLIVAFAVMAIALYGLYFFLKKFGRKISGEETASLKMLSRLRLDSRNSLALVQFHEEELLVAVNSAGGVQLLSKCAQIEIAEAEGNSGKVGEHDAALEAEDAIFDSFGETKASSAVSGIRTVKDGLL